MLGFAFTLTCAVALVVLGDLRSMAPEAILLLVTWGLGAMALRPEGGRVRDIFLAALLNFAGFLGIATGDLAHLNALAAKVAVHPAIAAAMAREQEIG
jgi:hypothetical protein